jgi:endoglucanase
LDITTGIVLLFITVIVSVSVPAIASFGYSEYKEALVKAVWFYDGNKCGPNAAIDNVFSQWRGVCHTTDGNDLGLNLTGGFHDNGGHVKYGLTQGYAASVLGWSLYEYKDIFDLSSQNTGKLQSTLKYFTDYLLACHPTDNIFYYQVGDRNLEEPNWGPPKR